MYRLIYGWLYIRCAIVLAALGLTAAANDAVSATQSRTESQLFDRDIKPILAKCIKCHGADDPAGELNLTNRESAVGHAAVVPGDAARSSLIERISTHDDELRMPPDSAPLPKREVEALSKWIDRGAVWPVHWAYRKLKLPPVPEVDANSEKWCQTPIDRFIVHRQLENQLTPSEQADRRILLRRVFFDLIGLPPTLEQTASFLNDSSDDAYDKVVDRLLASPHYGERWARHWMDLVHFAETHGHDQDRPRDHAWPYRDYLIRSFNADKPYQQFVQEQIAGDVLFRNDPWATIATGFLATGPWDESSLRDISEDAIDREIARYLDRDDIVTTVMSTFCSSSVHCARCHHHKFDPISQDEYYGLQAIFAATDKANRKIDLDQRTTEKRQQLLEEQNHIAILLAQHDPQLLHPKYEDAANRWEKRIQQNSTVWWPFETVEAQSPSGTQFITRDDQSLLVRGSRPDKDRYVVTVETKLDSISGLRLDLMTDESLPQIGPGRADNGNLHLNGFRAFVFEPTNGERWVELKLSNPKADFNQTGWSIEKAIDGNPNTAWGIHPQVGKSHSAFFQIGPIRNRADRKLKLRIELEQIHGGGHLIGCFRLSATNSETPLEFGTAIPSQIASILTTDPKSRTDKQRIQRNGFVRKLQIAEKLDALPNQRLVYCGTNQFTADGSFRPAAKPRVVQILNRGQIDQPIREAKISALSCVEGCDFESFVPNESDEASRRTALAKWISSDHNSLTWRSVANRLWQYHFGRGFVDTPNDFGYAGSSPSHPDLLDWIACKLRTQNGSLKSIHRLIVTSAVYRQATNHRPQAASIDTNNRLLWRMNRIRLDAESFRDALLVASDTCDTRMGGPSDRQFIQTKGVHVTPVLDYVNFDVNRRENFRRSVYRFIFRTVPDPFMDALDCPDPSMLTPTRGSSLTALQALATLNDRFVVRQSELIADRVSRLANGNTKTQVKLTYRILLGREPTAVEENSVTRYTIQHGLANACRMLINTNEFMFVD